MKYSDKIRIPNQSLCEINGTEQACERFILSAIDTTSPMVWLLSPNRSQTALIASLATNLPNISDHLFLQPVNMTETLWALRHAAELGMKTVIVCVDDTTDVELFRQLRIMTEQARRYRIQVILMRSEAAAELPSPAPDRFSIREERSFFSGSWLRIAQTVRDGAMLFLAEEQDYPAPTLRAPKSRDEKQFSSVLDGLATASAA